MELLTFFDDLNCAEYLRHLKPAAVDDPAHNAELMKADPLTSNRLHGEFT